MIFSQSYTVSIRAKKYKTSSEEAAGYVTLSGITATAFTPENAATQINKILALIGEHTTARDLIKIRIENVTEGGNDND